MDVTFSEQGTGRDWKVKVLLGNALIGTIRQSADLTFYRYFEGPSNDFTYVMDDHHLDLLKARIAAKFTRPPPPRFAEGMRWV